MRLAVILAALLISAGAMTWSAIPPGASPIRAALPVVDGALTRAAGWFRSGPGGDEPTWDAARRQVLHGDPARGRALMVDHGCGGCHVIPGIRSAQGTVGPSLEGFARRAYVAGILPNEPGDLTRWLMNPPAHAPRTAMPDLGLTEGEAQHMASYLLSPGAR